MKTVQLIIYLMVLSCAFPVNSVVADDKAPLNVIIFYADDLGYGDLGSFGHPTFETPEIDRLASEGQRWTDFYAAASVCTPSRGSLLTGKLPIKTGLYGINAGVFFPNSKGSIPEDEVTLGEAFKAHGYNTAVYGKWHLGDADYAYPTRHGFDEWLGLPYSNDMEWTIGLSDQEIEEKMADGSLETASLFAWYQSIHMNPKNEYWNVPLIDSRKTSEGFEDKILERPTNQNLLTKRYTERSVDFINEQAANNKPFFIYMAYTMPHVPLFASEKFEGKSNAGPYGDVIAEIDWSVGKIRETLIKNGMDKNTLIVFTSDNGPWIVMEELSGSAGILRDGKSTTFEGGMRVPTIFWWPSQIKPAVVRDIGSNMDLYTTTLSLAGAKPDDISLDGLDLSQTLLEQKESPRNTMAFYRRGELYAFRKGLYKIHFITQGAYGAGPAYTKHEIPLLYNLGSDPSEKYNLADEKPDVLADMIKAAEDHLAGIVKAESIIDKDALVKN